MFWVKCLGILPRVWGLGFRVFLSLLGFGIWLRVLGLGFRDLV